MQQHALSCAVAMATYNGSRHIEAQLRSIAAQTRPPNQIVVSDDSSTDDTVLVVRRIQPTLPCKTTVLEHRSRIGPIRNFERALRAVQADVVFLSDQDDIWRADKVAAVMAEFERDASIGGVFTNGSILSTDPSLQAQSLWDLAGFSPRERRRWAHDALGVLLRHNVVTGATLALRTHFLPLVMPLPTSGWHDLSLAVLLVQLSSLKALPDPLIAYRLHATNAAGLPIGSRRSQVVSREAHLSNLRSQERHWTDLATQLLPFRTDQRSTERILKKIDHLSVRSGLPKHRLLRLRPIVREARTGSYSSYGNGAWSVLRDFAGP